MPFGASAVSLLKKTELPVCPSWNRAHPRVQQSHSGRCRQRKHDGRRRRAVALKVARGFLAVLLALGSGPEAAHSLAKVRRRELEGTTELNRDSRNLIDSLLTELQPLFFPEGSLPHSAAQRV